MKKYLRFLIILFVVLYGFTFFTPAADQIASAANTNVYVAPTVTGDGSGSDWNNQAQWSTVALTRGNTYFLADGTYGGRNLYTAETETALITIKKATQSQHGIDAGWQTSYGDGVATFTSGFIISTGYWAFDGVTGSGKTGHGFHVDMTSQAGVNNAFYIVASHVTLAHTKISWPDRDGEAYMNETSTSAGIEIYGNYTGITLQYDYLEEIPGFPLRMLGGTDFLMEYCVFDGMHSDAARHSSGVIVRNGNSSNGILRYNKLMNTEGSYTIGFYTDGAVHDGWKIYGNLFVWDSSSSKTGTTIPLGVNDGPDVVILKNSVFYNNTIADLRISHKSEGKVLMGTGTGNTVYNNLFYGTNLLLSATHDYNSTYHNTATYCTSGATAHEKGIIVRQPADCDYLDATYDRNPFAASGSGDFTLAAAEDAGIPLGSTYNVDMLGNTRTNWTRGAYEYAGTEDAIPPAAPTGLSVR